MATDTERQAEKISQQPWKWSHHLEDETTRDLLEAYCEARLLSHLLGAPAQSLLTPPQPVLLVSASEFARFMNKSRQAVHLWARTGFLAQLGYQISYDITRHLSISIPPAHDQYQEFLVWRSKRQKRQER